MEGDVGSDASYASALGADGDLYAVGSSRATWTETPVYAYATLIYYEGDALVGRVNADGALERHTFLWASSDYIQGIALDDSGNIYVTGVSAYVGWTETPVRPFSEGEDAFVVKLGPHDSPTWHTLLATEEQDRGRGIVVDASRSVFVAGTSYSGCVEEPNRGYTGGQEAFVAALHSSGNLAWHTFLGTDEEEYDNDRAYGIVVDNSGTCSAPGTAKANRAPTSCVRTPGATTPSPPCWMPLTKA